VSLDTANRSFWRLVVVAFAPYLVVAALCCGVAAVGAYLVRSGLESRVVFGVVVAAVIVTVVVLARAGLSLLHQFAATRAFEAQLARDRLSPGPTLVAAAQRTRLPRVDLVDDDRAYSLTYGLAAPRVVVSRGLVERIDPEQLEAVFVHERYHVRNLDPLKVLIARVLRAALFFLPALGTLHDRYLAGRELAADRAAYRAHGKRPLAGALYEVAASPEATAGPAAAIGGGDLLEFRLAQLETDREPPLPRIRRGSMVATGLGVIAMTVAIAVIAGLVAGSATFGGDGGVLGLLGMLACGGVWALVAVLIWHRLARRHH
jgi:beta-lactamase regulating signal transducer with metallopeptidase domain